MGKKYIIFVFVLAAGCPEDSPGSKTDPCANETCSGHGQCVPVGESATCECVPGYRAVGRTCLADCLAVDCGGLGGGVVVDGAPRAVPLVSDRSWRREGPARIIMGVR
jgi:hypothetical protein